MDFPLLEVFSLISERPLPGMNKIPCLEARKKPLNGFLSFLSAVWVLQSEIFFFFHYTGDR